MLCRQTYACTYTSTDECGWVREWRRTKYAKHRNNSNRCAQQQSNEHYAKHIKNIQRMTNITTKKNITYRAIHSEKKICIYLKPV